VRRLGYIHTRKTHAPRVQHTDRFALPYLKSGACGNYSGCRQSKPNYSNVLTLQAQRIVQMARFLDLAANHACRSSTSLLYLIVFGSLIEFTAFVWLLARFPATTVASLCLHQPGCRGRTGIFLCARAHYLANSFWLPSRFAKRISDPCQQRHEISHVSKRIGASYSHASRPD
jgi:hypothetical protein